VSFPGTSERLLGFDCPFSECGVEHALADCATDVVLENILARGRAVLEGHAAQECPNIRDSQHDTLQSWDRILLSHFNLVKSGRLNYDDVAPERASEDNDPAHVSVQLSVELELRASSPVNMDPTADITSGHLGSSNALLKELAAAMRPEVDCNVCYAIFDDPITTSCGHTYCRACIHRSLDTHPSCPICRRSLSSQTYHRPSSSPPNRLIARILESFWPAQICARAEAARELESDFSTESGVPIFVCTVSLPTMPTVLHVFEPRYRLMIQRALQGDRTFGMVLPLSRKANDDGMPFTEVGTMLRIKNLRMFPDGRSLLEAVGISRFKVVEYSLVDDYVVARVERYDDVSVAEEEAIEAAETRGSVAAPLGAAPSTPSPDSSVNGGYQRASPSSPPKETPHPGHLDYDDIDNLPTASLLSYARNATAAKLRHLTTPNRGTQPDDPSLFPWWLASVLPTQESAKYRLLRAVSVRERLKICCRWLVELEEGNGVGGEGEGYVLPWIMLHTLVVFFAILFVWFWGEVETDWAKDRVRHSVKL
jgi:Lon protease-like protein